MRIFTTIDRDRGAFTIVEMLVVVVLIGLAVSAMGGSFLNSYRHAIVERAARDIMLSARYARVKAVESRSDCMLVLDRENSKFFLTFKSVSNEFGEEEMSVVTDSFSKVVQLDGNVVFEDIKVIPAVMTEEPAGNGVIFRPNGTADAAFVQVGDGKSSYTVYISSVTGRAKVKQGPAEEMKIGVIDLDELEEGEGMGLGRAE